MARNHEVTEKKNLLNPDGTLREPGWSKSLVQIYNREDIAAPKFRIVIIRASSDVLLSFSWP